MDYVLTNNDGRVCAWTFDAKYSIGFEQVELPDGFDVNRMTDWLYIDGEWTHDPLPEPEPQPTPMDELTARVEAVEDTANVALSTAEAASAGANPQIATFARMAVAPMAASMTIAEGASVSTLWPERKVGDTVKLGDFFWYGGELYRCNQPELTITAGQTPDMNLPALYAHVSVAPDGILVWDANDLTGAPDIYNTGVRVHHPGADGAIYASKRDGNTSEPGTDEWWEKVE